MSNSSQQLKEFISTRATFDEDTLNAVISAFSFHQWKKGDLILKSGNVSDQYIFLQLGCIRSFLFDVHGNEVTLEFYMAPGFVFEAGSFFSRTPSIENMEALTDVEGWVLSFEDLNRLFHQHMAFREFGRSILVKGFSAYKNRTLSMLTTTAEQRYEYLLSTRPALFQIVPLKYIASYLGITDSSLSRIRKSMI